MNPRYILLACSLVLVLILAMSIAVLQFPASRSEASSASIPTTPNNPGLSHPATAVPPSTPPIQSSSPTQNDDPQTPTARIDAVNTDELALGRTSYAYTTLTNTGKIPITNERVEITAGRDFGFPIGYRSRVMIHEYPYEILPGTSKTLEEQFNFPAYEGFIPLGGVYDVTFRLYINDGYFADDWSGTVALSP